MKTPQEQLDDLMAKFGRSGPERDIRTKLRARGIEPDIGLIREHIATRFAFSSDDRRCWGHYDGHYIDGHEAVRQAVNSLAVLSESAESNPANMELTPVAQVAAKLRIRGIYGL